MILIMMKYEASVVRVAIVLALPPEASDVSKKGTQNVMDIDDCFPIFMWWWLEKSVFVLHGCVGSTEWSIRIHK